MKLRCWCLALTLGLCTGLRADAQRNTDDPPRAINAAPPKAEQTLKKGQVFQIPYSRTLTQHILVRVKINGKGPFNLILDSGAPQFYLSTEAGKKIGLEPNDKKVAVLDRLDIEGGARLLKVKCIVDTPFQVDAMNGMGMSGVELHGMLGYSVLARFKLDIDFTKDKMAWTYLDYEPPAPRGIGKGGGGAGGLEMMGTVMKLLGAVMGLKASPEKAPRGFVGIELRQEEEKNAAAKTEKLVSIRAVLAKSPADAAGLKAGDRLLKINDTVVTTPEDVSRQLAQSTAGQTVHFLIRRGKEEKEIRLSTGEGL